jgi:hypothetical protein
MKQPLWERMPVHWHWLDPAFWEDVAKVTAMWDGIAERRKARSRSAS